MCIKTISYDAKVIAKERYALITSKIVKKLI